MSDPTVAEKAEQYREAAKETVAGGLEALAQSDPAKFLAATIADVFGILLKVGFTALGPVGEGMMRGLADAEDQLAPLLARYAVAAVNDIFGTDVSEADFSSLTGGRARTAAGPVLGRALMAQMEGLGAGALEPTDAPATKFVGAMAGSAIEDWYKGWFFEVISSLIPLDVGKIEKYGDLSDKVGAVLGLSGVSRRVLRPLVDTTIVTPLEWKVNRTYRPRLLSAAQIGRQLARGKWTQEQAVEELARQGYSDDRIEALLATGGKVHSVADYDLLLRAGIVNKGTAVAALTDQGFTAAGAEEELLIEQLKAIATFERAMANAAIDAFVAGRVTESELGGFADGVTMAAQEKAQIVELAQARRLLAARPLTSSDVEQCVKAEILSFVDYRAALRRENRTEDAIDALDLLLRFEVDKAKSIAQHKADLAEEKRRAAEAAAIERQKKLDAAAARKALARRGTEGDLERAAIRGLIPLDRVEEIYRAKYDEDTVAILLDDVETRRLAYIEQQRKRDEASKAGTARGVSVGQLETATLRGVLTLDEFRGRLLDAQFTPADAALLVASLRAQIDDRAQAEQLREAAAAAAKVKHVSVTTMETLVRRGHRSLSDYSGFLAGLGFDDAARAAMVELLQDRIDEDAAARAEREAAAARTVEKGLTLAQYRRAVLMGLRSVDNFQTYLVDNKYTADAQIVLVDELRADVAEAEAARQRREAADSGVDSQEIPLSRVTRAARLGILPIAEYARRLAERGYSQDDIALDVDLLVEQMAADADARRRRAELAAEAATKDPTLGILEEAVRAGLRSIDEYRARLVALGYGADDVDLLVSLLLLELDATADQALPNGGL